MRIFHIFIFILAFLGTINYNNFLTNNIFKVNHIFIEELSTKSKLFNPLATQLKTLKGMNIWEVDIDNIKEQLEKDIRIKNVVINKQLPDSIEFIIQEKKDYAYLSYKKKIYIIDKNGEIISYRKENNSLDLPLFSVSKTEEINSLLKVFEKFPNINIISQITSKENSIDIALKDGIKLKTNLEVPKDKYTVALRLYSELKKQNRVNKYIDLRFNNFIVK